MPKQQTKDLRKNKMLRDLTAIDRLPCARAFQIHRRWGVPLKQIGRICNKKRIKITACQLGCFR